MIILSSSHMYSFASGLKRPIPVAGVLQFNLEVKSTTSQYFQEFWSAQKTAETTDVHRRDRRFGRSESVLSDITWVWSDLDPKLRLWNDGKKSPTKWKRILRSSDYLLHEKSSKHKFSADPARILVGTKAKTRTYSFWIGGLNHHGRCGELRRRCQRRKKALYMCLRPGLRIINVSLSALSPAT